MPFRQEPPSDFESHTGRPLISILEELQGALHIEINMDGEAIPIFDDDIISRIREELSERLNDETLTTDQKSHIEIAIGHLERSLFFEFESAILELERASHAV